jgi:hypothetical protein
MVRLSRSGAVAAAGRFCSSMAPVATIGAGMQHDHILSHMRRSWRWIVAAASVIRTHAMGWSGSSRTSLRWQRPSMGQLTSSVNPPAPFVRLVPAPSAESPPTSSIRTPWLQDWFARSPSSSTDCKRPETWRA